MVSNYRKNKFITPRAEEVHQLILKLVRKINRRIAAGRMSRPEMVVAIGRGGWSWAKEVADWINVLEIGTLQMVHYKGIGQRLKRPIVLQTLPVEIMGKNILALDDVVETGKTMAGAKEFLELMGAKRVTTATLYLKPMSKFKPDFFGKRTDAWIIFYGDIMESVKLLAAEWMGKGMNLGLVYKKLLEIGLIDEEVREAMRLLFNWETDKIGA
jgi:hypoxanthine phosphoribosyltransferase